MRDPEMMIALLKEMSKKGDGAVLFPATITYSPSHEDAERLHHARLLVDVGHAQWESKSTARITAAGYDFLNAVDKQPSAREGFLSTFNAGATYAQAVAKALEIVAKIIG